MSFPDELAPPLQSLPEVLRGRRTAALIADAELIRDAPGGEERDDEARRSIREAMLLFALRRITMEERDRVLGILSFAKLAQVPAAPNSSANPDFDSPHSHDPLVRAADR